MGNKGQMLELMLDLNSDALIACSHKKLNF